ncbi:hypothetical protein RQM47_10265 [Rubrivirga sp. S365]|uniref:hypothetical protein n=1 Tax=Rubrivirga sp. S365 TaxID=3076080 RepID=UPI0028C95448|nr:hypothetical protein [Rubrivirga sp. S365]MDT7857025.1 hypothetical protein [Rubrivirga sp. S365]
MPRLPATALAVLLAALSGCFSLGERLTVDDVSRTYTLTDLSFRPYGSALDAVNLLERVDASATDLELFANEQVSLRYELRGENDRLRIGGTYSLKGDRVRLRFDRDARKVLDGLLLPRSIELTGQNGGATLVGQIDREEVDVSKFSDDYEGIEEVDGVLYVRLVERRGR